MRTPALLLALALTACTASDLPPADAGRDALPRDAQPRPDAGPPPEDLEGFVDWQLEAGGLRGVAVAITTPDEIVLSYTTGMATETTPVDEHTLFTTGSISKTFVALLAMQLAEEGLLDLDAPVDDVLPYPVRNPAFPDVPVTARMLLTHTSGLDDDFGVLNATSTSDADPDVSLAEFGPMFLDDDAPWAAEPGTRYSYCNACFGVLGHLIEVVSGEDLRARSEARIFAPLALDGAGWWLEDVDASRLAAHTTWNPRTRAYTELPQPGMAAYVAGTLRMSLAGMSRYAQAIARNVELDGMRVLEEATALEMRRAPFPDVTGRAHAWGYTRIGDHRYLVHSGSTAGTSTQLLIGAEDGVALIVLTNSDAYIRSRVGLTEGERAIDAILERLDREADVAR